MKRRLPAAEVERAFSVVRSNPEQRRKLEHGEEVDEIETDVGKEVRLDVLVKSVPRLEINEYIYVLPIEIYLLATL